MDVVNLLLDHGADLNHQTTSDGLTPLIFAVNRGHVNITRKLVDYGAKLDTAEFNNQNTALHVACSRGDKEIVQILANERTFNQIFDKINKEGHLAISIAEEKLMEEQQERLNGGPNINQPGLNNFRSGKKEEDENSQSRWWAIFEHLDNLRSGLNERATKAGNDIISEELADEQKRQRKIEHEN